eukprot:8164836-Pyramimonas_sp.AAC.1
MLNPTCCCPAAAVAHSLAFSLKPDAALALGQLYGSWVSTVEATIHSHRQQDHLGRSRSQGPEFHVVT